jgi:Fe-S-cluster containining protein
VKPEPSYPFEFNQAACDSCRGTCCRWGGYVWITEEEMMVLAETRGMELGVFADSYVRAAYGRLSLQDRLIDGENPCCLFDTSQNRCTVYDQRPAQCRSFPFWKQNREKYLELMEYCPGIVLKD